jgi:hypothetical protein
VVIGKGQFQQDGAKPNTLDVIYSVRLQIRDVKTSKLA